METKSKARHILYGTLFVVQMYRWGGMEEHNYTAGIFDNEEDAKACGVAESLWRANKYEPVIYQHNLNEWRNGTKAAMYEEIRNTHPNKTIEELFEKKEAYEWKEIKSQRSKK